MSKQQTLHRGNIHQNISKKNESIPSPPFFLKLQQFYPHIISTLQWF